MRGSEIRWRYRIPVNFFPDRYKDSNHVDRLLKISRSEISESSKPGVSTTTKDFPSSINRYAVIVLVSERVAEISYTLLEE